ncbi:MAG TPA: choice-of-anchor E domain-containing protein, partial [Bryobacteraceae bacterium]|nr:choice-of-anchor E domain-containing protein [Bryobacteraceae bacterium]
MKSLRTAWKVIAIATAACGLAAASTIALPTQTVAMAAPSFTDTLSFVTFDQSLGTLTNVEIDATADFDVNLNITDPAGNGNGNYSNAKATGSVNVLGPGDLDLILTGATATEHGSITQGNTVTYSSLP